MVDGVELRHTAGRRVAHDGARAQDDPRDPGTTDQRFGFVLGLFVVVDPSISTIVVL